LKNIECSKCKSVDFEKVNGTMKCVYCRTTYVANANAAKNLFNTHVASSVIEIDEDILLLLNKIKAEPWNKTRYANMILDIDSTNEEALKILNGS